MVDSKRNVLACVENAIVHSRTLTVKTATYLPHQRAYIDTILGAFLDAAGMSLFENKLAYCVHELAANAAKANTKRLFFKEKNLIIDDPVDYAAGMSAFREEMVQRADHFHEQLRSDNLFVKFHFCMISNGVRIIVRNNTELTTEEQKRILEKQAVAERYTCLADAYTVSEDRVEGAGLGIVMMLFMLKKLGFRNDAFSMRAVEGETVATLKLITPPLLEMGALQAHDMQDI